MGHALVDAGGPALARRARRHVLGVVHDELALLPEPCVDPHRASTRTPRACTGKPSRTAASSPSTTRRRSPPCSESGGYRTGFFGKYLDSYQSDALAGYVPPGWNRWVAFVHSEYLEYGLTIDGTVHRYGIDAEDYSTDVLADETEAFIRGSDGPVFAVYAPPAPHAPGDPRGRRRRALRGPATLAASVLQRAGRLGQAGARAGDDPAGSRPHVPPGRPPDRPVPDAPGRRSGGRSTARRARGHGASRRRAGDLHLGQRPALGRAPLGEEGGPVRGGDPCPARDPRRSDRVRARPGGPAPRVEHRSGADDRGGGRPAAPGRGRAQSAPAPRRPTRRLAPRAADRASARDEPDPDVLRGPDVAVPVRVLRHGRGGALRPRAGSVRAGEPRRLRTGRAGSPARASWSGCATRCRPASTARSAWAQPSWRSPWCSPPPPPPERSCPERRDSDG